MPGGLSRIGRGSIHTLTGLALALVTQVGCDSRRQRDLPFLAGFDFDDGRAEGMQPRSQQNWQIVEEDGSMVYQLAIPGEPREIRAPTAWALVADYPVGSFVFSGRLKSHADAENPQRDMSVLFHFQDSTHFYYVHFSAMSDETHNIIGLVNGADRVRISREPPGTSPFRLTVTEWHDFKITFDAATGEIEAFLDDMETPILTASDTTFRSGLVGVGSFDDTGSYDDLMLWGENLGAGSELTMSRRGSPVRLTVNIR